MNSVSKFLVLAFVLGFHDVRASGISIKEDPQINKIFNKSEIVTLERILAYFDSFVMKQTKTANVDSAYHSYSESLLNNDSAEDFWRKIGHGDALKDSFLVTLEGDKVFSELWVKGYDIQGGDTLGYFLMPNWQGKYMKYLDYLITQYPIFKEYRETIFACGAIPPTLAGGFPYAHKKLDFGDERIRLFSAIHYITLETYLEKRVVKKKVRN